jgi:Tfp pilus assembly protein PilW
MQSTYRVQLEAAAAQQEGRFALQWIERYLRAAGNNPYRVQTTACPVAGTPVRAIRFDPNGNGLNDDIRVQTDSSPTDGIFGGLAGACNQANEDVSIQFDAANNLLRLRDNITGVATARSDSIVEGLEFIYRNPSRVVTANPENVAFIETRLRVRTKIDDQHLGDQFVQTVSSEIRVRVR